MSTLAIATGAAKAPPLRQAEGVPSRPRVAGRAQRRLLRGLAQGDPSAADAIQAEYGRVLLGYLRQMLDDAGAAEDVMQQVLLEAWQRGPSFDPERASVLTWLMTIARSRAIDVLRRRVPEPHDPAVATALLDRDAVEEDHASELAERWQMTYLLSTLSLGSRRTAATALPVRHEPDRDRRAHGDRAGHRQDPDGERPRAAAAD